MNTIPSAIREREAAALKRLFDAHKGHRTQRAFGKDAGLGSAGMVWQYLNGHRPLNLAAALKFAAGLGVHIDSFSPRLGAEARAAAQVSGQGQDQAAAVLPPVVNEALLKLPSSERQEYLEVLAVKLRRAGEKVLSERLGRYVVELEQRPPSSPDKQPPSGGRRQKGSPP